MRLLFAVSTILFLCNFCFSQVRERFVGQHEVMHANYLLSVGFAPELQAAIELTEQQKRQAMEIQKEFQARNQVLSAKVGVDGYTYENLFKDQSALAIELSKKIRETLVPWQAQRLDQVTLQQIVDVSDFDFGLNDESLSQLLKLSDEQIRALKEKQKKYEQAVQEEAAKFEKELKQIRKNARSRMSQVLSASQRKQFDEMFGKIFYRPWVLH
jgi:hypothetical protein